MSRACARNQSADGHSSGQQLESFKAAKSGKLHGFLPCKLRFRPAIVGSNNL
jgi:hypothetical protein